MREMPTALALENLESRLNLSTLATLAAPASASAVRAMILARLHSVPALRSANLAFSSDASAPAHNASGSAVAVAPTTVTAVHVSSTAWTSAYLDSLATSGQGSATLGYQIPTGSGAQFATLDWNNLNEISITFSQNVTVSPGALQLTGYNVPSYAVANFSYDSTNHTATWTFAKNFPADNLMITLSAGAVTDGNGNALDGEWIDGLSSTSGNGTPGGNFTFHFNVLPGDVNHDGVVDINDQAIFSADWQQSTSAPLQSDFNGDGVDDINDLAIFAAAWQTSITVPVAPANLNISNASSASLTLNWTDNAPNQTGFTVYRSADDVNFTPIATLAANTDSFNDANLTAGTTYFYEVAANFNDNAGAATSSAISYTTAATQPQPTAPSAPSNLAFSNVATTSLTLNWTDNSSNESGLYVYRSQDNVNFTRVATLGVNSTSFTDSGLNGGSTYYYEVSAYNSTGETSSASAAVQTLVAAPSAPANLAFSNIATNSLTLNWTENSSNAAGFTIYRSTDNVNFTAIATVGNNFASYTDATVAAGTTYFYEVAAYNSAGSVASASASVATAAPVANPLTISTQNMTSFTELDINGTSGNDSILVTQSNNILSITGNGQTTTIANTFGDIVIHGFNGNDTITVDSSVNIATLIYGGDGNDTIINQTTGKATIVTIGNGVNTVTGNGVNTSYWVNPGDVVNASATEIANGAVNRVANWYQPATGAVPRGLYGQNLADPTDSGSEYRLTNNSFWGTGPTMNDINQGQIADCYYLAPLASLANNETVKFMNTGVDLGDGTYAVRFVRNGVTSYVRVDGDISANGYAHPGASGNMWGLIYEKAYAFFRTGADTYASLNDGFQSSSFSDLGFNNVSINASSSAQILSDINNSLNSGYALAADTHTVITGGAPLIASHDYSVIGAWIDSSGTLQIELRNPWGFDGAGNDGDPSDGLVTIPYATFAANFYSLTNTTT